MIDTKSKLILKILAKECGNGNYKIVEISDIIMALPRHLRMDSEAVRHILTYLERQDMISIKYDDDNVYCLAVLPYGFQTLESDNPKFIQRGKDEKRFSSLTIALSFLASFLGTLLGIIICYYLIKLL